MKNQRPPRLARVIWWSLRLSRSRRRLVRQRCRQQILDALAQRWQCSGPESPLATEAAVVRAVWLGASLVSRSLVRCPLLPPKLARRLAWVIRLFGKSRGQAMVAAYLSWTWLYDMAVASRQAAHTWNGVQSGS